MLEHSRGVKRPHETMNNYLDASSSHQKTKTGSSGLTGGLAGVHRSIQQCLPRLGETITCQLVQRLQEVGVHCIQDLEFTAAEDIGDIVKPIQARKLMKFWAKKQSDVNSPEESTPDLGSSDAACTPSATSLSSVNNLSSGALHAQTSSIAATGSFPVVPSPKLEDNSRDMLLEDTKLELCFTEDPLEEGAAADLTTADPELVMMRFVGVHFTPPSTTPCAPPELAVVPKDWVHRTMGKLEVEWPPPSCVGGGNEKGRNLRRAALICSAESFEEAASKTYSHWPNVVPDVEEVSLSAKKISSLKEELKGVREQLSNLSSLKKDLSDLLALKKDLHGLLTLKNDLSHVVSLRTDLSNLVSLKADLTHVVSLKADLSQQLASLKGMLCDLPAEVSALRSSLSTLQTSHGPCQDSVYEKGGGSSSTASPPWLSMLAAEVAAVRVSQQAAAAAAAATEHKMETVLQQVTRIRVVPRGRESQTVVAEPAETVEELDALLKTDGLLRKSNCGVRNIRVCNPTPEDATNCPESESTAELYSSVCINANNTATQQEGPSKTTSRQTGQEWAAQITKSLKESAHQTKERGGHSHNSTSVKRRYFFPENCISAKRQVSYSENNQSPRKLDSYSESPKPTKNGDSNSENFSSVKRQVSYSGKCSPAKKRYSYSENSTSAKKQDSYSENGTSAKKCDGIFGAAITAKKMTVREPLLQVININPDVNNSAKQPLLEHGNGLGLPLKAIGAARTLNNVTVGVVDCCEPPREEQKKNRTSLRMPRELLGKLPIVSTDNIADRFAIIERCSVWLMNHVIKTLSSEENVPSLGTIVFFVLSFCLDDTCSQVVSFTGQGLTYSQDKKTSLDKSPIPQIIKGVADHFALDTSKLTLEVKMYLWRSRDKQEESDKKNATKF